MHSRTTAPEILEAFAGERLDYFVTGFGTGGTLKGVARVLREQSPQTKVIVCEPDNSQTLGSGIRSHARRMARPPAVIRTSGRISCRAGARISFRSSPKMRSRRS